MGCIPAPPLGPIGGHISVPPRLLGEGSGKDKLSAGRLSVRQGAADAPQLLLHPLRLLLDSLNP